MKLTKLGKRILSTSMVCLISASTILSSYNVVSADSNDRISTYINLAAGKNTSDLDIGNMDLSKKDLQFLGIYISNFFVPFGTELGELSGDEDTTEINKEDIKKALQTNLNFSDSMADSMTENLLGLSRSSIKELSLYVSENYQENLKAVSNNSITMPLNGYTATASMLGGLDDIASWYGDTSNKIIKGIADGTYKYGYFAYEYGGRVIPVFDFDITMSNITPSQSAFIKCLESIDIESGYGFSFFDFTKSEMDNSEDTFADLSDSLTEDQAYKMSAYGTKVNVDCFGNIIYMGSNHQYVAVPGCMNPYTWATVDSNGNLSGKGLGGTAYNIANIPSMVLQESDGRLFSGVSGVDNSGSNSEGSGNIGEVDQKLSIKFTGQAGKGEYWFTKLVYDDNYGNTGIPIIGWGGNDLKECIDYVIDYVGGSEVSSSDFTTFVQGGTLYVKGKASKLASLDSDRVTDKFLNSPDRDASKAKKMRSYLNSLEKNWHIYVEDKDGKAGLESIIKSISREASNALADGSGSTITGNTDVNMVKQGILDTSVLVNKLKSVNFLGGSYYALRRIRGDKESSLSGGFLDLSSDFRSFAKLAEQGFIKNNKGALNYYGSIYGGINESFIGGKTKSLDVPLISVQNDTQLPSNRKVDILDSFYYIDDLGAAHFDESSDSADFSTFNVLHYLSNSDEVSSIQSSMKSASSSYGFTNTYKNIQSGKMEIPTNISKEAMVGLYVTYAFAGLYDEGFKPETIGKLGYMINSRALPEIPDEALILSSDAVSDYMLESIRDWTYYFLHPTEGIDYFATWAKNKLNGFMLRWHDDMVGTKGTGSINGTTKYRGFSGYVTTPELSDMPWTDSLLDIYTTSIPFFLIFMILAMLGAYVVGILNLQKALIGLGIFAVCVTLPPVTINGLVGTSNRFSSSLYGEKFTYWALVQHEGYSKEIDEAASSDSYSNYLKTLYATNSTSKANQGSESIVLKWQAPKKVASLMLTNSDEANTGGLLSSSSILGGLINSTYSGESYLDDEDSVYLYRSYIDIANFSRYIHRGLSGSDPKQPVNTSLTSDITENWDESLKLAIQNYSSLYESDRNAGYANKNTDGSADGNSNEVIRVKVPLSSRIVSDAFAQLGTMDDLELDDYVGIPQGAFNFSIPMFNVGDSQLKFLDELKDPANPDFNPSSFNGGSYTNEDYSGLAAYGLMSENPFYYFSWYLYEVGLSEETTNSSGYKNLLLGEDNAGFFYNTSGNGELKDFMDMRSLFTYIIPYLRQGNDVVKEWDDTYGIFIYEGVPTEEGHENDPDIKDNPELRQKYWHNLNVARLYNLYTPWVDVMYDCSYAKEEKISYLGDDYVIADPINSASYPEERPMIFSRSEMVDYGLSEKDLTKVEKLIIECEEGMQERMFKLLNYHNFNDVVLDTAAAMNCAFEFNETFSENSIVGANHNIYPQSFELNDFSYDAFLRFILSSTTGESMLADADNGFYQRITTNSSMTTVIAMLILDILAMYIIPGLKMFFIVGIFLLSILIILMAAFKVDPEQKFVKRLMISFMKPMFQFMLITCGMAWVVSLFMGEGNTDVTGALTPTISLGDPVMVMVVMIVLNSAVIYLYFKILKGVWKDIVKSGKLVGNFLAGVFGSVVGLAKSSMIGKSLGNFESGGTSSSGKGGNKDINMGSPNPRASQRGNSTIVIQKMEESKSEDMDRKTKKYENSSKSKGFFHKSNRTSADIEDKTARGMNKLKNSKKD